MLNSIRQYLSQNYQFGNSNSDNYQHPDKWRQQRNHHVSNWLTDMAANQHQPFYQKDNRPHFWNRRRKKKDYFDPTRQSFDESMYYNNYAHGGNNRLKNRSSHKSLSSLSHKHKDEDDYGRNRYQQDHNISSSQHNGHNSPSSSYRRQRHHSLPSSSKNPLKHQPQLHHHQPFMNGIAHNPIMDMGIPALTAAAATAGNHLGGMMGGGRNGGLGNPFLSQHYHQQQQPYYHQQQQLPMQGQQYNNRMFDHHNQQQPYNSQSQHHQGRHHFSNIFSRHSNNDRSRHQYQSDRHSLDIPSYTRSYNTPEHHQQQQAMDYYHQQQQQQQQYGYPYNNNAQYGNGGGINSNYYIQNNRKRHN